jgi:hypothetical protein
MLRIAVAVACTLALVGCAQKPQVSIGTLSQADPKFSSPECLDIRSKALTYDDKVGERMAIGLASGLLLGPFGIPIAASADAAQNQEREAFNREIELRCMTNPPKRDPLPVPDTIASAPAPGI